MSSSRHDQPGCDYENCGSTRFTLGDDGYTYCHRGHQQSEVGRTPPFNKTMRGTVTIVDPGELTNAGKKSRRRGGESDGESVATSRGSGFTGSKALEHYLLCVQLVLRKQAKWIIEEKGLPQELNDIVRDLWALRLQKLQHRLSYDSETETEGTQSQQFFSSQSEGDTSASASSRRSRPRNSRKLDKGTSNLRETLSICYTALLLLREPVTVGDIYDWVSDGKLPYYHVAKQVPLGMRERLPAVYQNLLEPGQLKTPDKLQKQVLETVLFLRADFGMAVPAINASIILYRWVRELSLPVEVFVAALRLGRKLEVDFTYITGGKKLEREVVLRYPEARLMACLIVATKLLLPADGIKRDPGSATDLAAMAFDWSTWMGLHSEIAEDGTAPRPLNNLEMMNFSQSDTVQAADAQVDQYMDWFEQNIASEEIREQGQAGKEADFRRTLVGMFSVEHRAGAKNNIERQSGKEAREQIVSERLNCMMGTLKLEDVVEATNGTKEVRRTGSDYRRYRQLGELEGPLKMFYEQAAVLAGLSAESMVRAVFLMERKVQKYEERLRKGGRESSGDES